MLMNLFSSFNPTQAPFSLNWLCLLIPLIFIPMNFMMNKLNRQITMILFMKKMLMKEIKPIIFSLKTQGHLLIYTSTFLFIALINMISLYPYIFSATTHMAINLSMAFPLWLMLLLYGWLNLTNSMFSHLTPESTPMLLAPMMVLIETVSNLIRPITLSVRLTANLIAGHLLIILLSSLYSSLSMKELPIMIFPQLILLSLEIAVAIIQAYIFVVLTSLYLTEIN